MVRDDRDVVVCVEDSGHEGLIDELTAEISSNGATPVVISAGEGLPPDGDGPVRRVFISPAAGRTPQRIAWAAVGEATRRRANLVLVRGMRTAWSLAGNAAMNGRIVSWLPGEPLSEELRRWPRGEGAIEAIGRVSRLILVDDELSRIALIQAIPQVAAKIFVFVSAAEHCTGTPNVLTARTMMRLLRARYRVLVFDDLAHDRGNFGQHNHGVLPSGGGEVAPPRLAENLSSPDVQIIRLTTAECIEGGGGDVVSIRPRLPARHLQEGRLLPRYAAWHLAIVAEVLDCDVVLPADAETALAGRGNEVLLDRMWPTLAVASWDGVESLGTERIGEIVDLCRKVVVPSEGIRSVVESRLSAAAGKSIVLPWTHTSDTGGTVSSGELGEHFAAVLERQTADYSAVELQPERLNVLLAGHDFKFAGELVDQLTLRRDLDVRIDKWDAQDLHDPNASRACLEWADVIICEFASHNAVWYSWEKLPHQKLLVRFHGYEVNLDCIRDLNVDNIDSVVFVSEFFRRRVVEDLGWEDVPTSVVPNMIDSSDLDRGKLPEARFHLGMAGIVPILKRPDRALDLLENLLERDARYTLHLRGRNPWEYSWMWKSDAVRDAYEALYERLLVDPALRARVSFDDFGPDMGRWFQKIGWVLSPSTRETFHLAPVEGMASGAVPVVWDRPGASEIFGDEWLHGDTAAAADYIHAVNESERAYEETSARAQLHAVRYDLRSLSRSWLILIRTAGNRFQDVPSRRIEAGRVEILFGQRQDADRLGRLVRVLQRDGHAERVAQLIDEYPALFAELPSAVSGEALMRRGLAKIAATPGIVPARSSGAIYKTRSGQTMSVRAAPVESGRSSVAASRENAAFELHPPTIFRPPQADETPGEAASQAELTIDKFIIYSADRLVREARASRPAALVSHGDCWVAAAVLIASRRLGVPFILDLGTSAADRYRETAEWLTSEADGVAAGAIDDRLVSAAAENHASMAHVHEQRSLRQLRVGLIADQFTTQTVSGSFDAVPLRRADGYLQVAVESLDGLFIESAWEGPNDEWRRGVAHSKEGIGDLQKIIEVARHRGIPVLFWNKEDPVHFANFAGTAALADHVFTTDGDRVPAYLGLPESSIQTASALPFYAQPQIHHPLPTDRTYEHSVSYAGTYYGDRFRDRSIELHAMLEGAARHGLTIYDRQVNVPNSPYHFPPELAKFVKAGVAYEEVLKVYKTHPVNINVNSARDSPTMFSRRVVEIAASGGVVLSGLGRGISDQLRGIPATGDAAFWDDRLAVWMEDEGARLDEAWKQLRCIARSHLADQALTLMFRTAGLLISLEGLPPYALRFESVGDLELDVLLAQTHRPSAVAIAASELPRVHRDRLQEAGIGVVEAVEELDESIQWIADGLVQGRPTYFEDLLHAVRFGEWSSIGAQTWRPEMGRGRTLATEGDANTLIALRHRNRSNAGAGRPMTWLLAPDS